MKTRQQDIEAVTALQPGNCTTVAWSKESESGGVVYRLKDKLLLFEVQDNEEKFVRKFKLGEVEELVDLARSWT